MFLEEIDKNQIIYIEKAKNIVIKYFVDFFGENYRDKFTNILSNLPMFFIDKAEIMLDYFNFLLAREKEIAYIETFESLNLQFKNIKNNDKVLLSMLVSDLFNTSQQSSPKRDIKFIFDLIGKNKIEVDDELVKKLKKCYDEVRDKINLINKYIEMNKIQSKKLTLKHYNFDKMLLDKNAKKMVASLGILTEDKILNNIDNFCDDEESDACYNVLTTRVFNNNIPQKKYYKYCLFPNLHQISTLVFVHELLHAVSNDIIGEVSKTGFQIIENDNVYYSYLNEIVTEYFAISITKNMDKNKDCPFFRHDVPSYYSRSFNLIEPFIKKYGVRIKKFYMDNNAKEFENYFGKFCLSQLNDLLLEYSGLYLNVENNFKELNYKDGLKLAKNDNFVPENLATEKFLYCYRKMEKILGNINTRQKSNMQNFENI